MRSAEYLTDHYIQLVEVVRATTKRAVSDTAGKGDAGLRASLMALIKWRRTSLSPAESLNVGVYLTELAERAEKALAASGEELRDDPDCLSLREAHFHAYVWLADVRAYRDLWFSEDFQ